MIKLYGLFLITIASAQCIGQTFLGDKKRDIYDIHVRGMRLAAVTDNSVELWNLETKKMTSVWHNTNADVFSAVAIVGATYIATGTRSGEVALWTVANGSKKIVHTPSSYGAVTCLDVDSTNQLLAFSFRNNQLVVYDVDKQAGVYSYSNHTKDITGLKFSTDGMLFSADATGKLVRHIPRSGSNNLVSSFDKWITCIGVDSTDRLAVADNKGSLFQYILEDSGSLHSYGDKDFTVTFVTSVDFLPNRRGISFSALPGRVYIETPTGKYSQKLKAIVTRVQFVPRSDGYFSVAVGTKGKGLLILDAANMDID